ncbi:hypothetical protein GOODEAATRI_028024 [Goodea atripinnis]|uniref:Uncharacterized protein n=1 Tax=Goodea atripinnis TaxID=208336 RepID=A0ABV0Q253_9TELE
MRPCPPVLVYTKLEACLRTCNDYCGQLLQGQGPRARPAFSPGLFEVPPGLHAASHDSSQPHSPDCRLICIRCCYWRHDVH